METILLAITVGAVLIAVGMGVVAWRVSRAERARAAARVAALAQAAAVSAAALDEYETEAPAASRHTASQPVESHAVRPAAEPPALEPEPSEVTIEPRSPWTAARVSAFTPMRSVSATAPAARVPELVLNQSANELPLRSAHAAVSDGFLAGEERRPSEGRQRVLAAAAAVLFIVLGTGGYWLISGQDASAAAGGASAATTAPAPLELLSLRHERIGTRLTLSGLVRNPSSGAAVDSLSAVAFLFDAQGGFITSARTGVDFKHLAPGDESPFVITLDAPANVARYRVSFRTDAGIQTHVDRRAEQPATTAIAGSTGSKS